MARILLATVGSLGDLHPCIAVGRALAARGHAAVVATAAEYQGRVEDAGLRFATLSPSLAEIGDPAVASRAFFHPLLGPRRLFDRLVMQPLPRAHAELRAAAVGCDLLVSHPLTPAVPIVARELDLPWASMILAPFSLFSASDPPRLPGSRWLHRVAPHGGWPHAATLAAARLVVRGWERPLRRYRSARGFAAPRGALMIDGVFAPGLNLGLFDPELAAPQPDWPAGTVVCGAPRHDAAPSQERATIDAAANDFEAFAAAGEPPLVFALGSAAVWMAGDFWRHAAQACEALGRRGVLLTGGPTGLALPPSLRAWDYLPYSTVFPRAAAVVHQCGIGTLSAALRAGVPQLLVPVGFDQPDNAARAARLGVARVLPFRRARGAALRDALAALLADVDCASRAAALAPALAPRDGAAVAALHLERELRTGGCAGR